MKDEAATKGQLIHELMNLRQRVAELKASKAKLKRAEEALKESEKKYRLLLKNLPNIVYKGFKDWSIEFIDNKIELLTGYNMDEFNSRRMKWSDIIIKNDIGPAKEKFIQALKTDKSYVREYRIRNKYGSILWIQARGQIVCNENGDLEYVSGVFFDITERKRAEEMLKQSRDKLEKRFDERTFELLKLNKKLQYEIEERKQVENDLRKREAELEIQTNKLEELNAALRVLLERREEDKKELKENVLINMRELVVPYIERLKKTQLDSRQEVCLSILESNLYDITSPFLHKLSAHYLHLTPTEIKIANLVKEGKTTKDIGVLLNLSTRTVEFHRKNIRKKLGIANKKVNLRSHLLSM